MMCQTLGVSRSGYYDWGKRSQSLRQREDEALAVQIKEIYYAEKQRVGSPRITIWLKVKGYKVGENRVAKIMRINELRAKGSKKFKATTNSNHKLPVAPNLLEQDFEASKPNEKWVSDLTYIWTDEGWLLELPPKPASIMITTSLLCGIILDNFSIKFFPRPFNSLISKTSRYIGILRPFEASSALNICISCVSFI